MAIIPRGENTYLVRVYLERDPVTKKRVEINKTVHGTLATARKVEAKLKSQKESGQLRKTAQMTLNALLDQYLDSSRHLLSESTQDKNRTYFHYYVRPYIGSTPLRKINNSVIQTLFNFLLDEKSREAATENKQSRGGRGLAPNTVKSLRKTLKVVFNYAISEKLIADNPVHGTKLPPVLKSRAKSLTIEEAHALIAVKDDFWYGNAFVLQLHTGLRPQELMALIWEDVDFEQGTLRIERALNWLRGVVTGFGPTKDKRVRIISLAPEHLALLKAHLARQQKVIDEHKAKGELYGESKLEKWVMKKRAEQSHLYASARLIFPRRDGSAPNHTTPRTEFKEMLRHAGIKSGQTNYRWYDLRHTHATFLLSFGLSNREVAERMGHSVNMLLTTYAHFLESRRSFAATLFVEHIPVERCPPDRMGERDAEPRERRMDCRNGSHQLTLFREESDDI